MFKRITLIVAIVFIASPFVSAQITTSSISGTVFGGEKKEALAGASVLVIHEPTGTKYATVSSAGGRFKLANVIPGGPYSINVSFVGSQPFKLADINIPLGDNYDLFAELFSSLKEMEAVILTTTRSAVIKTGASVNFNNRQIQNMPNIGRSLTALTRRTPQSNGNSFAGMNYRFNNITIDGALFNNNFGRSGDGLVPGGGIAAISIETIDQIQLNIAPYDVRQAGFIGGGINAVTKRGTNEFKGAVYNYYRNQNFNGEKVNKIAISNSKRTTSILGAYIGGPIIKNKIFFFGSVEKEKRTLPGQTSLALRPGVNDSDPNTTTVLATDLDQLSQYIQTKYNFNPGKYEEYDFETEWVYLKRKKWF